MSKKLLSCGGLYIDDETITETDGILSASSGGELPEVTAEDNGDVLTVVDGAWAKAVPSGGGLLSGFYDRTTKTLDKTWQEIYDATGIILFEDYVESETTGRRIYGISSDIMSSQGMYGVLISTIGGGDLGMFLAESADGYPVEFEGKGT